jgi:hypothetical protein
MSTFWFLNVNEELRAMTSSPEICDMSVMTSSVIPYGEVLLLRVAAHVGERQHRQRRKVGDRQSAAGGRPSRLRRLHPKHARRTRETG